MMAFILSARYLFTYYGVVKIKNNDIEKNIIKQVEKMEEMLITRFNKLEDKLTTSEDAFLLIPDGLKAYKERCLKDIVDAGGTSIIHKWREKARTDEELHYPHKKILDFMIGEYDYTQKKFKKFITPDCVRKVRSEKIWPKSICMSSSKKDTLTIKTPATDTFTRFGIKTSNLLSHSTSKVY